MERQKCPISTNKKHTVSSLQHPKSQCNRLRSEPDIPKNNQFNWANSAETIDWRLLCWEHVMDIKQRADIDVHHQRPDNVEYSAVQSTQIRVFWGNKWGKILYVVFGDNIYWYWSLEWCCSPQISKLLYKYIFRDRKSFSLIFYGGYDIGAHVSVNDFLVTRAQRLHWEIVCRCRLSIREICYFGLFSDHIHKCGHP